MTKKILVLICALLSYILSFGQSSGEYYLVEIGRPQSHSTDPVVVAKYCSSHMYFISDDGNKSAHIVIETAGDGVQIRENYLQLDFWPAQVKAEFLQGPEGKVLHESSNSLEQFEESDSTYTIDGYYTYQEEHYGGVPIYCYATKINVKIKRLEIETVDVDTHSGVYLCDDDFKVSISFTPLSQSTLYAVNRFGTSFPLCNVNVNKTTDPNTGRISGVYGSTIVVPISKITSTIGYGNPYRLLLQSNDVPIRFDDVLKYYEEMPPIYQYYPLSEEPYVQDSTLYIGLENIATGGKISIRSDFYPSTNKGEISLDNSNYINQEFGYFETPLHGPYTITFHKDNHCSVSRNVFVPEVTLNKVNGSENVFWYEDETRKAVTLHLKYPEGRNDNITYTTNNNLPNGITVSTESVGKISILDTINFNKSIDTDCIYKTATFTTDASLKTIDVTVTSSGKKFIPVKINLEGKLKAYPNIELASDVAKDIFPHCNYSDAVLKFPKFKGGLSNGYYFQLNDEDSLPIPQTSSFVLDKSLKSFSVKIFDNFEGMRDTIGRLARSLDLGTFTVHRPPALQIIDSVSHNLQCHNDSSGSIEIKAVQRTYDDKELEYHWFKYPYTDELAFRSNKADHLPADSYRLVIFNDDCKDTSHYTITQPDTLLTSITSVTNAMCYGYHDGAITTETTGGTGQYTYAWSNGATTNDIDGLPIGRYYVTVTDEHGCEAYANDTITQPDELINSLTPSYTICQGGELLIDDGKENRKVFDSYEWHLPDSTTVPCRTILVTSSMSPGKYALVSKKDVPGEKDKYCFTTDTTLITFADNDLPIRFLVPTESFLGDTLVVAEDSEIDADYTWRYAFNPEMFTDYTDRMASPNVNQTYLYVNQSGNDTITMYAENGFCKASLSKAVTIINDFRPEDYDYTIASAGIFSRLQIGPNPNNGEFTLFANLTEDSPLTISLYDVMRSRKIPIDFSKYKTPASHYQIPFQGLGLRSGAYTLLVSANGETKQIKFVVE
ncbi:MAG: hypothetical protein PUC50_05675 [Bacteroidales bacterium]|nr:hypothetical protein [Bacteroidales bacterium]